MRPPVFWVSSPRGVKSVELIVPYHNRGFKVPTDPLQSEFVHLNRTMKHLEIRYSASEFVEFLPQQIAVDPWFFTNFPALGVNRSSNCNASLRVEVELVVRIIDGAEVEAIPAILKGPSATTQLHRIRIAKLIRLLYIYI